MSGGPGSSGVNNSRNTPKDAQVMISLLREMGISDYEPRVLDHMLDFTYSELLPEYTYMILNSTETADLQWKRRCFCPELIKLLQLFAFNLDKPFFF